MNIIPSALYNSAHPEHTPHQRRKVPGARTMAVCEYAAAWDAATADACWTQVQTTLAAWRAKADPIIWFASTLAALLPGTYVIYRWYYYRRSQLQVRFRELLTDTERQIRGDTRQVLRTVMEAGPRPSGLATPTYIQPLMVEAMQRLGFTRALGPKPLAEASKKLTRTAAVMEEQLATLAEAQKGHQRQQTTVLLLQGAVAAAQASTGSEAERHNKNREALGYFARASALSPNDVEARFYSGHQHRLLGELAEACAAYEQAIAISRAPADDPDEARIRFLSRRIIAELKVEEFNVRGVKERVKDARDFVDEALDDIPLALRDGLEHAAALVQRAKVYGMLGLKAASQLPDLLLAESIYGRLREKKADKRLAEVGLAQVRLELARLRQADQPSATSRINAPSP
jgi:tetratricopeptide (TPR) repeat protein